MIRDAEQKRQKHFSLEELNDELYSFWLKDVCEKILLMKFCKGQYFSKKGIT